MDYKFVERTENKRGSNWYGHHISFYLDRIREMELFEFLEESFGPRGKRYRYDNRYSFNRYFVQRQTIRFQDNKDAFRFKLSWVEDVDPMDSVYEQMKKFAKLNLNSMYGKMIQPTSSIPKITPWSSGPIPASYSSRSLRNVNPGDMIIMDYESTFDRHWYSRHMAKMACQTWSDYQTIIDAEVTLEEQSDKTEVDQTSKPSTF